LENDFYKGSEIVTRRRIMLVCTFQPKRYMGRCDPDHATRTCGRRFSLNQLDGSRTLEIRICINVAITANTSQNACTFYWKKIESHHHSRQYCKVGNCDILTSSTYLRLKSGNTSRGAQHRARVPNVAPYASGQV